MKITVSQTTTKEVDVTFPHYRRSEGGNLYVAIFSEYRAIKVGHYRNSNDINIVSISPSTAISITDMECTQNEFMTHYENAVTRVNNDFDALMGVMDAITESKAHTDIYGNDSHESNEEEGQNG